MARTGITGLPTSDSAIPDLLAIEALSWTAGNAAKVLTVHTDGTPILSTVTAARAIAPAFPYATDFANVAAWEVDPLSGVWQSKRNANEAQADLQTGTNYASLGGASFNNVANLNDADYSGGTLTWKVNAAGDATTAPQLYWTIPAALMWDQGMVAVRVQAAVSGGGIAMGGLWLADNANPTTVYFRTIGGYDGAHRGYAEVAGSGAGFGNFTLAQATSVAGYWQRYVTDQGRVSLQINTSSSTDYPETGWGSVIRSTGTAWLTLDMTLRVGVHTTWSAGAANPETFLFSGFDNSQMGFSPALGVRPGVGFGFVRTRASTAIPVIAQDIGASATYSDAEIIARLSRAVNVRGWDAGTVRAYIYRGSAFTQPADGAAWVTFASGTFSELATVGTGAKLSIWLDVASTNGASWWSFDPIAFGALGIS